MAGIATFMLGILLLALPSGGQTPLNSQTRDAAKLLALNLPADTALLAKLNTDLGLRQSKAGDEVQAETTEDVRQGKGVLLKKGSLIVGHISFVEPASPKQPDNVVGVQFDRVMPKNGPEQSLHVIVRALAPHVQPAANAQPGIPHAQVVSIDPLSTSSVGVSNLPGLRLGVRRTTSGQQTTVLAWIKGDIKLKKESQLLMVVVGQ
jgi:hypothetical protein